MSRLYVALRLAPGFVRNKFESEVLEKTLMLDRKSVVILNPRIRPPFMLLTGLPNYEFDFIFTSTNSLQRDQREVFERVGLNLVRDCMEGFNCSIFSYGVTGTGKTYTIFGNKKFPGLIPECCKAFFELAPQKLSTDVFLEVSFYEIHNEHVYDLLATSTADSAEKISLRVREHPQTGPYVENLSKHAVLHPGDIQCLIDRGTASSEKILRLPSHGYLSETKNINKSLCTFSTVIRRLGERNIIEIQLRITLLE